MSKKSRLHAVFDWEAYEKKREVVARDGDRCVYCGQFCPLQLATLDHLTPKSRGGPDTLDNLVTSCRECNLEKGDMMPLEYVVKGKRRVQDRGVA